MHARKRGPQGARHRGLVGGVGEREQQPHRHRLGAVGTHRFDRPGHRRLVERDQDTLRAAPFDDLVGALVRDQGRGVVHREPVEVRAGLAAQFEHVPEALRGDQGGARSGALEQGVGADGHAVGEARHVGGAEARLREGRQGRGDDALALVLGRRRHLRRGETSAGDHRRVGEGSSHVHADQGAFRGRPARLYHHRDSTGETRSQPHHARRSSWPSSPSPPPRPRRPPSPYRRRGACSGPPR